MRADLAGGRHVTGPKGGLVHLRVSDLGMEKGKTPVTEERIGTVAVKLRELLEA